MAAKDLRLWRAAVNLDHAVRMMDHAKDDLCMHGGFPLDGQEIEELRGKLRVIQSRLAFAAWAPNVRDEE